VQVAASAIAECCEGHDAVGLYEKCTRGCCGVWGSLEMEVRREADVRCGDMM